MLTNACVLTRYIERLAIRRRLSPRPRGVRNQTEGVLRAAADSKAG